MSSLNEHNQRSPHNSDDHGSIKRAHLVVVIPTTLDKGSSGHYAVIGDHGIRLWSVERPPVHGSNSDASNNTAIGLCFGDCE
jgi:hypothetical protein